jgi:hypothetical protein
MHSIRPALSWSLNERPKKRRTKRPITDEYWCKNPPHIKPNSIAHYKDYTWEPRNLFLECKDGLKYTN